VPVLSLTPTPTAPGQSFLQLVNACRQEAGVATSDLTTLQTSMSMESTRFKNWINREWLRIQADKSDWQWMRQTAQFNLQANVPSYSPTVVGLASTPQFTGATFGNWKRDSFRIYSAAYTDEMLAGFMPWDTYRNVYQYGSMRDSRARPVAFSVAPDKSLWFGITPDAAYGVVFEYYTAPIGLAQDADTPTMPAQYHDLIMYRALRSYGVFMAASEVIARAQEEINRISPKLLADQLPIFSSGPPLA
jgi:hypothetical protein